MVEVKRTHLAGVALASLLALGMQQAAQAAEQPNHDYRTQRHVSHKHVVQHYNGMRDDRMSMREDYRNGAIDRRHNAADMRPEAYGQGRHGYAQDNPNYAAGNGQYGNGSTNNFYVGANGAWDQSDPYWQQPGQQPRGAQQGYVQGQRMPPPGYDNGYGYNTNYGDNTNYGQSDYYGYYNNGWGPAPNPVDSAGAAVGGALNAATLGLFAPPATAPASYGYGPGGNGYPPSGW
jgi:hypothetical protein